MATNLAWQWQTFHEMAPETLYRLLQLRSSVFIIEQNCAYQDMDGKDLAALHLLGWAEGQTQPELVAAARLILPNPQTELSFGRVVVDPAYRGRGYGEQIVANILDYLKTSPYQGERITISAQHRLVDFYGKFGFKTLGQAYEEDGIPHIRMVL